MKFWSGFWNFGDLSFGLGVQKNPLPVSNPDMNEAAELALITWFENLSLTPVKIRPKKFEIPNIVIAKAASIDVEPLWTIKEGK